ncbi:hypothetical protein PHYSODRAFT_327513 [Phytophthora sojae]|uniref:RxLR effector protein n=1 Tax=Phytophthora sojae (strain P6497) TaxID=1094619 RepID=G4ZAL6_PHYSP|nr:hypothetical protein PHYSODRAFT_327513 [Phytophthora sojae]EGZ19213.1 hypothetical protein PHYSODRAFT_327513 [Phytophthora sojae]|eukprot:XP_009521930.1 hypothetical protein PHYSODRAFT_327513 [Phytophthora sojae]
MRSFALVACGVLASTANSFADATSSKTPTAVNQDAASFIVKEGNFVANVTIDIKQEENSQDPESGNSNDDNFTQQETNGSTDAEERALVSPAMKDALKPS